MAEVQTSSADDGRMGEVFVRFLVMQQQQALMAMGRHPSSGASAPPANLALAKVFLDQLAMIAHKTRGNLSAAEVQLLQTVVEGLRREYEEASEEG